MLLMGANIAITRVLSTIESENLKAADTRVGIMTEVVSAMKAVKFFAWEEPYLQRITDARMKEMRLIRWFKVLVNGSIAIGLCCCSALGCAAFCIQARRFDACL